MSQTNAMRNDVHAYTQCVYHGKPYHQFSKERSENQKDRQSGLFFMVQ